MPQQVDNTPLSAIVSEILDDRHEVAFSFVRGSPHVVNSERLSQTSFVADRVDNGSGVGEGGFVRIGQASTADLEGEAHKSVQRKERRVGCWGVPNGRSQIHGGVFKDYRISSLIVPVHPRRV